LALERDVNSPEALRLLRRWVKRGFLGLAYAGFDLFGLERLSDGPAAIPAAVTQLAVARRDVRAAGEWDAADALREEISALGYDVRDTSDPPGFLLVPLESSGT
jgi:cysteinyl-tRNA synthetase